MGGRRGLVGSSLSGERDYDLGLPEVKGVKGESAGYANTYGAGAGGSGSRKADCLVLDLDGTLLNRDCVITPRTAEALRECAAAGVTVFIATGKARPAAIRAAATAGLDGVGGVVSRK